MGTGDGTIVGLSSSGARKWSFKPSGYGTGYAPVWARDSESLFYVKHTNSDATKTVNRIAAGGGGLTSITLPYVVKAVAVGR